MKKRISHSIQSNMPGWPGNPMYYLERHSGIENGDSANTFVIHLFNHYGTHLDAPRHFNNSGPSISEIPFDHFFYEKPLLLDLPKEKDEKIMEADLTPYHKMISGSDLLMLRTGFQNMRTENPQLYKRNGPAISSEAASYLRRNFTGSLKAIALDFLSLGSPADDTDCDLAHRIMLGTYEPGYICVIEDVNMIDLPGDKINRVTAIPLILEGVDSSPVTMWAEWQ